MSFRVVITDNTTTILDRLHRLSTVTLPEELQTLSQATAEGVRDAARVYDAPSAPTGRPMRWASERQRRSVMAAIREGRIQVPYRRTGRMGQETVAYPRGTGTWVAEIRSPYARFVRGDSQGGQSDQHRGRWTPWTEIVERGRVGLLDRAREAIAEAIERAGL